MANEMTGNQVGKISIDVRGLIDMGVAIHEAQGGRRADFSRLSSVFSLGTITTCDYSDDLSWSNRQVDVNILSNGINTTMRAEDGGSGADDPVNRCFFDDHINGGKLNHRGEKLGDDQQWVTDFLGAFATAKAELAPKAD